MTEVRGFEVAHDLRGSGPTLVWGHGLTSSMADEDELGLLQWDALRRHARVLRYDARGHGRSGSTPGVREYHWRALAEDQLALADALGIEDYVAGGASMGCATALHAALLAPGRVRGLLLVIPPTAWASRAAQAAQYEAAASLVEGGKLELVVAGAASGPVPDPFLDDDRWRERFAAVVRRSDPERLARIFRGAATADLPAGAELARLRVPTLILAWTGDAGHPVSTAARLQELMPHAELALATTSDGLATWTERATEFLRSPARGGSDQGASTTSM